LTDVSDELTADIMDGDPLKRPPVFTTLHGATSQKATISNIVSSYIVIKR
jgi:hypothetical protein